MGKTTSRQVLVRWRASVIIDFTVKIISRAQRYNYTDWQPEMLPTRAILQLTASAVSTTIIEMRASTRLHRVNFYKIKRIRRQ